MLASSLALAGCPPYDGPMSMTFEGRRYLGYGGPVAPDPMPGYVAIAGTAADVHAPVRSNDVLTVTGVAPATSVLMLASSDLGSGYIVFISTDALQAAGSRSIGEAFPELCPLLTGPQLRLGCPGAPTAPPASASAPSRWNGSG